jgi:hypothetical protein
MLFKLIVFAVIGVAIYRAFGGKVPILDTKKKPKDTLTDDTLIACDTCGTYVTIKESITIGKKHYCSKECIPN